MHQPAKYFLFILILLLRVSHTNAEKLATYKSRANTTYAWLTGGFYAAVSMKSNYAGYAAALMPTVQRNQHVFLARCLASIGPVSDDRGPARYFVDSSLLYGRCIKNHYSFLSIAVGPSYIRGMERGKHIEFLEYEEKPFHTIGLSIDAQAFMISPIFGFGLYGIVNMNDKQPYWSILASVSVGRILSFR